MVREDRFVCEECKKIKPRLHKDQRFCDRHCARLFQARRGEPSAEDKEARFVDEIMTAYHRIFDKKDK